MTVCREAVAGEGGRTGNGLFGRGCWVVGSIRVVCIGFWDSHGGCEGALVSNRRLQSASLASTRLVCVCAWV